MTDPAACELIGRWRIVESDQGDRDYLDLAEPASIQIGDDGPVEFAFGVVTASGELEYSRTIAFFRWAGSDEGDEISGDGSVALQDDGTAEIMLSFNNGDDAVLIAYRE